MALPRDHRRRRRAGRTPAGPRRGGVPETKSKERREQPYKGRIGPYVPHWQPWTCVSDVPLRIYLTTVLVQRRVSLGAVGNCGLVYLVCGHGRRDDVRGGQGPCASGGQRVPHEQRHEGHQRLTLHRAHQLLRLHIHAAIDHNEYKRPELCPRREALP